LVNKQLNIEYQRVKKLRKGDVEAFNQLFYAYSARLYYFVHGYLKNKEDAEELVQEIFSKIWEKRTTLDEHLSFKSYLFTIAFNAIKKHFRRQAYLNRYFDHSNANIPERAVYEDVDYASLKALVDKLVDNMPEKRKAVFLKSRYEGKNAQEISDEMSISKSTVENHLNQALKYLRQHLDQKYLVGMLYFLLFL
jgi:RNA polymerase sigma-70 factor (ECF subfamily)